MLIRRQNGLNTELVTSSEALMNMPGMTLARQAGRLDAEVGRFAGSVEDLRSVASRLTASFIRADTIFSFTFGVVTSVVFAIGAWLVTDGRASIGTLVLFLLYIRQVQIPLNALTGLRYDALRAAQAFDRVFEVLGSGPGAEDGVSLNSAVTQPAPGRQAAPGRGLAFDDVRYRYQSIGDLAITSLMNPAPAQGGTYEDAVWRARTCPSCWMAYPSKSSLASGLRSSDRQEWGRARCLSWAPDSIGPWEERSTWVKQHPGPDRKRPAPARRSHNPGHPRPARHRSQQPALRQPGCQRRPGRSGMRGGPPGILHRVPPRRVRHPCRGTRLPVLWRAAPAVGVGPGPSEAI